MNIRKLAASAGIVASGAIALSSAPAHAFSFTTNYTESLTGGNAAKGDIFLDSVTLGSGEVITDFTLVNSANILSNDIYTGGNSGAASADIGDLASTGLRQEALTDEGAKAVMNNLNLNNIIDTEDKGSFILDLNFENQVDNIFIWERGMNSRLDVQALDSKGELIGTKFQLPKSNQWDNAGFKLDTKEIGKSQKVGSVGVSLADLGLDSGFVSGLRVTSEGKAYNGPDFKVLGSVADTQEVPEPSALLGLGAVVAGLVTRRRKSAEAAA